MVECSVIIPVFNQAAVTRQCLSSLLTLSGQDMSGGTDGHQASPEIIVVDDGSTDETPQVLREFAPWISAVSLETNQGFAVACNAGAMQAQGKYLVVTHVLYFNKQWQDADGGQLLILRSQEMKDVFTRVSPEVGSSAIFVRSNDLWHVVAPVAAGCERTRRSLTVTFYHEGAVSTMWPPGETPELHNYPATAGSESAGTGWKRWLHRAGIQ